MGLGEPFFLVGRNKNFKKRSILTTFVASKAQKRPRYIEVIKKVLPSRVLFSSLLGATSKTGQNNNKSS
jgi:hypothetical protein